MRSNKEFQDCRSQMEPGFFESLKISFNSTDIWARRTLMNALESSGARVDEIECSCRCDQPVCQQSKLTFDPRPTSCTSPLSHSFGLRGTLTILPKATMIVDGTNLGIQVVKALKKPLLVLGAVWRSEDIKVFKTWLQEWFGFESNQ